MPRLASTVHAVVLVTTLVLPAAASSARAQGYRPAPRLELTPFGGYQWGGSIDTDAFSTIPAGKASEEGSFSWGAIVSFIAQGNSALELFYLRQDTDVKFNPDFGASRTVGDFANNYIQLGGRQEFAASGAPVRPFVSASLGINILDPKGDDLDTSTRFAWTLGGGAKFMAPNQRIGFRLDLRWMVTPVPSGTYSAWCDFWGCFAVEGTSWLHQGQVGGGLIFAF